MKMTEKVLLSNCKDLIVLNDGAEKPSDKYTISIPNTDFIILEVGAGVGKATANFKHPNIAKSVKRIYEFKHYRQGGSKFWTSQAGISHYLIIPANQIYILPEEGYSYIKAEINGVKVTFNVSGGGGSEGWQDYLQSVTSISVNHKLNDIKKLCEVAIRNPDIEEKLTIKDTDDLEKWQKMSDKASSKVRKQREKIYEMIDAKKPVKIILNKGYAVSEGQAISVSRKGLWATADGKTYPRLSKIPTGYCATHDCEKGPVTRMRVYFAGYNDRTVKIRQIDWVETCKANFE